MRAHPIRNAFYVLLLLAGTLGAFFRPETAANRSQRTLTFAERVAYQRAIEEVYWRHRIWPKERPDAKPPLDAVMSQAQLEKKVADYLRNSQALEDHWHRPLTAEQLQAEMDRMAQHTKQPEVLREIFAALGNDPFIIAECLAGPILSERLKAAAVERRKGALASWQSRALAQATVRMAAVGANYTLPVIASPSGVCTDDTWTATSTTNVPVGRSSHTAVWTGSEMIVWGGVAFGPIYFNTGGRYNPSTDSWTATSTTKAPDGRSGATTVWTGTEMIVWGGLYYDGNYHFLNTGGRYNPSTDSWTATSTTNAPDGRQLHTTVWTGSQMIVWGGRNSLFTYLNTGGRYNLSTDSWTATSTTTVPSVRGQHTAVWTGSEMIVWGGYDGNNDVNTGGRYNPSTDSWTATNTVNAPDARDAHAAVWTGGEMIVWGGESDSGYLNTGGQYNPTADSWTAISTINTPTARGFLTAMWTASQMIVWGGWNSLTDTYFNTGGRYNPSTDSWAATSTTGAPSARGFHTAVWTDSEMIVWGGDDDTSDFNTGGRYCAAASIPTPTPTPTATATATATPTPTPTPTPCSGRCSPTPRPRPTASVRPTPPSRPTP